MNSRVEDDEEKTFETGIVKAFIPTLLCGGMFTKNYGFCGLPLGFATKLIVLVRPPGWENIVVTWKWITLSQPSPFLSGWVSHLG